MPEAAPAAEKTEGASPSPAPASPEASTSQPKPLEARLKDAIAPSQPAPGQPAPSEHWEKVAGRQSEELGRLRKEIEDLRSQKAQPSSPTEATEQFNLDEDAFWKDPAGALRRIQETHQKELSKLREELTGTVNERLKPVDDGIAVRALQGSNPLARELLNRQDILDELTNVSSNQDLLRSLDGPSGKMAAALFHLIGKRFAAQAVAKETAPPPDRPENAGAPSPKAAESPASSASPPTAPKNMDEAIRAFGAAMRQSGANLGSL